MRAMARYCATNDAARDAATDAGPTPRETTAKAGTASAGESRQNLRRKPPVERVKTTMADKIAGAENAPAFALV